MPSTDHSNMALFGEPRAETETIEGHAGPVTFQFTDLSLRHIRLGEVELARRIYFAVRTEDWDTAYPVTVKDLQIRATRRSFEATWVAHCRRGDADYQWKGCVHGRQDGSITFAVEGQVLAPFRSPRIGLNVLLGGDTCAGRMFELTGRPTPQGTVRYHEFTRLVPRTIVADSLDSIRFCPADGVDTSWHFTGSDTSMEDQRNWAESTYKIFAAMTHGYPDLPDGQRGSQTVTLTFPRGLPPRRRPRRPVIELKTGALLREATMPPVGVELHPDELPLSEEELALLRRAAPAHLTVPIDAAPAATAVAKTVGARLIAVVPDGSDATTAAIQQIVKTGGDLAAIQCTAPTSKDLQRLRAAATGVPVGGPAATDFGQRPSLRGAVDAGADFLSWGVAPNMHLEDDETFLENARGPAAQLATARYLLGHDGAVVGPVHLRPEYTRPGPDPRHAAVLAAAYAGGVLCCLAAGRAAAGTFFAATGEHGLIHRRSGGTRAPYDHDGTTQVYPIYTWLKLAGAWRGRPLRRVSTSDPLRATLLAVDGGAMVVNLTTKTQQVRLRGLGSSASVEVRTVAASTFDTIRHGEDPPPTSIHVTRGRADLELEPCAVVFAATPKA